MNIVEAVRNAGVVGAGGAGFPTHVKLQARVDTIIANGAECEPLLCTDRRTMAHFAEEIVNGLELVIQATGAEEGIIGVKEKYADAVEALSKAVAGKEHLRLHLLGNFYPAGDEHTLVNEVTGRIIPEGGLPLNVGVVVNNVNSLRNISRASQDIPVTSQIVTVGGAVTEQKVLTVPLGTPFKDLLKACGGVTEKEYALVVGGPMMGRVTHDTLETVTKTTTGLIVLPADHSYIMRKKREVHTDIRWSQSQCEQCRDCTEFCPRWLLGHSLEPHRVMRVIDYNLDDSPHAPTITRSHLCCECGICDHFACPMDLSPRVIFKEFKRLLGQEGVKNPHHNDDLKKRGMAEFRKVPTDRLMQRLNLQEYDCYPELNRAELAVERVSISLRQHIGAPARPVVKAGDTVEKGDLIGEIPENQLGARVHASIDGIIQSVGEHIVIRKAGDTA